MAYSCDICGKGKQYGHNVPFSQKKTNKVWKPNLQPHTLRIDGHKVRVKICAQCLRTLAKYEQGRQPEATTEELAQAKTGDDVIKPDPAPKRAAVSKPVAKSASKKAVKK